MESDELAELRRALNRAETILDESQELSLLGSWEWDIASGELEWSTQTFRNFGVDAESFRPTFDGYLSRLHPDDVNTVTATLQNTIATGEPFDYYHRILLPDGSTRTIHARGRLIRDGDGKPVRMVGTGQDVTEMKERDRLKLEAELANRAKMAFLAAMSHELRTPLNAISGYADLLLMEIVGPLNEVQHDYISRMQRSGKFLLGLINDVLNFAKIDAGVIEVKHEHVEIPDALVSVQAIVEPQIRSRGQQCTWHVADGCRSVTGDGEKIEQVLLNLLTNASKFTPDGGRIELACERADDRVEIRVSDTGRGIPSDKLEAIFDPFVQVDRAAGGSSQGVGLGLAISRELARAMGGDIVASSVVGEGSVFTFALPAGESTQMRK
jgi:signal transduction histidine kinase